MYCRKRILISGNQTFLVILIDNCMCLMVCSHWLSLTPEGETKKIAMDVNGRTVLALDDKWNQLLKSIVNFLGLSVNFSVSHLTGVYIR